MRKLSITLIAAMLFSTGAIFANDFNNNNDPNKTLSEQIGDLLEDNSFTDEELGKTAEIVFTLNSEKEIVVLSVDAENHMLDSFIKSRLNYQEVEIASFEQGKTYTVKVSITS